MEEFRASYSRWRLVLLFLLSVDFVVLGLLMVGVIGEPSDPAEWSGRRGSIPPELVPYASWFCVIFFAFGAAVILKRFFDDGVQVAIGATGIHWSNWSDATIPWDEIVRVSVYIQNRQKSIVLHLLNPEAFPGRGIHAWLASANRMITGGDIAISLIGTDRSFEEAMAAIEHFGGRALLD